MCWFCSAGKYIYFFLTNENIILLLISYIVKIDIPLYIQCTCIQYSVQKKKFNQIMKNWMLNKKYSKNSFFKSNWSVLKFRSYSNSFTEIIQICVCWQRVPVARRPCLVYIFCYYVTSVVSMNIIYRVPKT